MDIYNDNDDDKDKDKDKDDGDEDEDHDSDVTSAVTPQFFDADCTNIADRCHCFIFFVCWHRHRTSLLHPLLVVTTSTPRNRLQVVSDIWAPRRHPVRVVFKMTLTGSSSVSVLPTIPALSAVRAHLHATRMSAR